MAETGGISPLNVANITHHLSGIDFPKKKSEIVDYARKKGVEEAVLRELEKLPEKDYISMADVMQAYGDVREKAA